MLKNPVDGILLLKKFAISYNYSAGFLTYKNNDQKISYSVLGMAPFSGPENAALVMPALPSSIDEINNLSGRKLSGADASKSQFVSLSGEYPIIHLATHAVANDTNLLGSYIEFYGLISEADSLHRLYEQEIYTLNLKSVRLVILSACETGNGLLVNGEGVMSLSRAFSYAGCKSIVTSLWKADEISTSFIAKRLHHYLQQGFSIDDALQRSKIDYLETNEIENRYKNPAYWAHLVLLGDFHPIVERRFNWPVWIGLIALLGLVIFIFRRKMNRA
jgi:LPXTG-motif cell wall-anchored protein